MRLAMPILLLATVAQAATYHVVSTGSDANDGSSGNPWRSVAHASSNVVAGDIVRITGHATAFTNEAITFTRSGTPDAKITFIAPDGGVTNFNYVLTSRSNIVFVNLALNTKQVTVGTTVDGVRMYPSSRIEFWHCKFTRAGRDTIRDTDNTSVANNALYIGNEFTGVAGVESRFITMSGTNNLASHNIMRTPNVDCVYMWGRSNVLRNSYMVDPNPDSAAHTDAVQTGSTGPDTGNDFNLVECNFFVALTPGGDQHWANLTNDDPNPNYTDFLFRRNVIHDPSSYAHNVRFNFDRFYIINETHVGCPTCSLSLGTWAGGENSRIYNTLNVDMWTSATTSSGVWLFDDGSGTSDYNLAYDMAGSFTISTPFSNEANSIEDQDPAFTDRDANVFTLTEASPAKGTAGPLTTVATASGSGTTFAVFDAGYFRGDYAGIDQYGGTLHVGDTITVGTDVRQIATISGSNVTVTASLDWTQGDNVFLGGSTTPDMGAYPYGHVKLTAATFSGTTVAPTGDCAFVVAFSDGIPHTVDNASPYEFPDVPGTVTYRAYAQYASDTPWVDATAAPSAVVASASSGGLSTIGGNASFK